MSQLLLYSLVFLLMYFSRAVESSPIIPRAQNIIGTLNKLESRQVDNSQEFSFQFAVSKEDENFVVETQVGSLSTANHPITFEVRHQIHSQSWQLPFQTSVGTVYRTANRTICINPHLPSHSPSLPLETPKSRRLQRVISKSASRRINATENVVTVTVTTLNPTPLTFSLIVRSVCQLLPINASRQVNVTATTSQLLHFHFPPKETSNSSAVIVLLSSNDTRCLTVSVQQPVCPFLDQENKISYEGSWLTMTQRGAVTVQRDHFPYGFFLVLVLHSSDKNCLSQNAHDAIESEEIRVKGVDVIVKESISDTDFLYGWLIPLIVYCFIIIYAAMTTCCTMRRRPDTEKQPEFSDETIQVGHSSPPPSSLDIETDATTKAVVTLDQMTTKSHERLERKSKLFVLTVIIVATYYCLPAGQLVFMYLTTSEITGNLDMCYHNFECAYPLGRFNDFNHFYSNIGYVAMGIAALFFLWRQDFLHTQRRQEGHGIPSHFGISYALACAIIAEGVLSGCYHVCPNQSNFHHDTCFMYVAVTLTALKLYQGRHPDSNISAPTTFLILSVIMVLDLFGEKSESENWWYFAFFTGVHFVTLVLLATQLFFLGRLHIFSRGFLKKVGTMMKNDRSGHFAENPMGGNDVYVLIWLGWGVNIGVVIYNAVKFSDPNVMFDFGTYILVILGSNMGLYFGYYLFMKSCVHKEKIRWTCWINIALGAVVWFWAFVNFIDAGSAWEETPAISRTFNKPCHFFDSHDIWHLTSAAGLFITLMLLELLDLELLDTPHEKIEVF